MLNDLRKLLLIFVPDGHIISFCSAAFATACLRMTARACIDCRAALNTTAGFIARDSLQIYAILPRSLHTRYYNKCDGRVCNYYYRDIAQDVVIHAAAQYIAQCARASLRFHAATMH